RERDALALVELELRDRAHVLTAHLDGRAEDERVRPGRGDARVIDAPDPGHYVAIVETDHELRAHRHGPVEPFHDSHDVGGESPRRHEVDRPDPAFARLEDGLQDQRVGAVTTL